MRQIPNEKMRSFFKYFVKLFFFVALLFVATTVDCKGREVAGSVLDAGVPKGYVSDFADILSVQEVAKLEEVIGEFDESSSVQIAVVTVKSLEGMEAGDLAQRLAQKWGVGSRDDDNGILILVKPKYKGEKGRVFIAVGYGLEHVIPDAIAKRVVERVMIPSFRKDGIYWGIYYGVDSLMGLSTGEYTNGHLPIYQDRLVILISLILVLSIILLPFIYLFYLRKRAVPEKYACYYIKGVYNSANIFDQLDLMETVFGQKYSKFRKHIKRYEYVSRNHLIKYAGKIDRNMFCYLLNGRDRKKLFWEMSDPFLKFMVFYLLSIFITISIVLRIEIGWTEGLIAFGVSFLIVYAMFNFLLSFLEIYQFSLRNKAKYVGGVSVALFALNAMFKRSVKKTYNGSTNSWAYAPIITYGGGGGGFGGGGFGGFGGGGFGGGGAGGSW